MDITVRKGDKGDACRVHGMLAQIGGLHERARPDIFRGGLCKYSVDDVEALLSDPKKPVFVADDGTGAVGYAICIEKRRTNHPTLRDARVLYIDDFCVDESCRGRHIGRAMMEYVVKYARDGGFDSVELNVWEFNEGAKHFYRACGFRTQRRELEFPLK